MQQWKRALQIANATLRCEAKTRKSTKCQSPSMANGRCRMHGGSAGAPLGNKQSILNANEKLTSYRRS